MRIHSLVKLGLLAVLTAACHDSPQEALTAPDAPLRTETEREIYVRGGTWERHVPGGTFVANYSGGQIYVRAVSGGVTTPLGQMEADWDPAQSFTEPTGGDIELEADAYSGCTFDRWRIGFSGATSTSNPLLISAYPTDTQFRGEFICVVD